MVATTEHTQEVVESTTDLDDRTKDIDVTNVNEDIDTAEILKSGGAAIANFQNADLAGFQAALRQQHLSDLVQASRQRDQLFAQQMRQQQELSNQNQRHNDHTLIDLHAVDGLGGGSGS